MEHLSSTSSRFQVGADVFEAFTNKNPDLGATFQQQDDHHWLCDLYRAAELVLQARGVSSIHGGGFCTFSDSSRFFSYRRDGATGRMASIIWLDPARN